MYKHAACAIPMHSETSQNTTRTLETLVVFFSLINTFLSRAIHVFDTAPRLKIELPPLTEL